jgi:hypothetical protein
MTSLRESLRLLQKSILILLIVLGLACFVAKLLLASYYLENRPREPRSAEGLIYPEYIKVRYGATVFLTERERLLFEGLMPAFLVAMIIGYLLNMRWKHFAPYKKGKQGVPVMTNRKGKGED